MSEAKTQFVGGSFVSNIKTIKDPAYVFTSKMLNTSTCKINPAVGLILNSEFLLINNVAS